MTELFELFFVSILISLATFGGGAQALFYDYAVVQNDWITRTDLSAVLSIGYSTPGPAVFGTATFIGYNLAGLPGAAVGTLGIFIVPFLTAFLAARYLKDLLRNPHAKAFTTGVGLAATGLIAATAIGLLNVTQASHWQFAVAVAALAISLRWKVNPLFVLPGGAVLGLALP